MLSYDYMILYLYIYRIFTILYVLYCIVYRTRYRIIFDLQYSIVTVMMLKYIDDISQSY
jgi:hypothetical protein